MCLVSLCPDVVFLTVPSHSAVALGIGVRSVRSVRSRSVSEGGADRSGGDVLESEGTCHTCVAVCWSLG